MFLHDLIFQASIGAYASEIGRTQRIRVNVDLFVHDEGGIGADDLDRVLDYAAVHTKIADEIRRGHVRLVETLAERLAHGILADDRVQRVRVRLEKLDILPDGAAAGVEIERGRND